jgi:lipopolysaccharide transport system ATP-binding protein
MNAPIIDVQRLAKRYQLGGNASQEFWALKDVSFSVRRGEVVGIVGRNGAGKSTLLKILSRITEPTNGKAILRGRAASLLEVGTGFHPDLSGRENVFLNGAILGMKRAEIARKFDEIVAFSEIASFIDTPVKRYSSGMYVRLAFAVAAHLDPDILIVDEVLAVGDAEFQKKCTGKMRDVASNQGRTVLFVSHNMGAVSKLCDRAIVLETGKVKLDGTPSDAIATYLQKGDAYASTELHNHPNRAPSLKPWITHLSFVDNEGNPRADFAPGERITAAIRIECSKPLVGARVALACSDSMGERIFAVATFLSESNLPQLEGHCIVHANFELPPIAPSSYQVDLGLWDAGGHCLDEIHSAAAIDVRETNYLGSTHPYFREMGHVLVRSTWSTSAVEDPEPATMASEGRP